MVRFIHAADLHMDRAFEGLANLSKQAVKAFTKLNQQVLTNLVSAALANEVDFLLLAGDTFHQNKPSLKTQHFFFEEMQRLAEAQIPVYMIFGNHDYYDPQRYWFEFPKNVTLFTSETVTTFKGKTKAGETYAISGFSYTQPWIKAAKATEFPNRSEVDVHIGLYHGDSQGERYAPFLLSQMKAKNYDYWALGHIHVPTVLNEQPPIVYPGTTQGHTKKETTTGSQLVEITAGKSRRQMVQVAEISWQQVAIPIETNHPQAVLQQLISQLQPIDYQALLSLRLTTKSAKGNFLTENQLLELMDYMNELFARRNQLTWVYEIQQQEEKNRLTLPASTELVTALLTNYQETTTFEMIHEELLTHQLAATVLNPAQYQEEILTAVAKELKDDFYWEESK